MQMFAYSASRTRRLAQRVRNAAGAGRYSSPEYRSRTCHTRAPSTEADGQGRGDGGPERDKIYGWRSLFVRFAKLPDSLYTQGWNFTAKMNTDHRKLECAIFARTNDLKRRTFDWNSFHICRRFSSRRSARSNALNYELTQVHGCVK